MESYPNLLVRRSLAKTWGIGDSVSSAVGALVPIAGHIFPAWERTVSSDLWQIPVYALAATALFRFLFFAPYELWRDQRERTDANDAKADQLLSQIARDKPDLVLELIQIGTGSASAFPDKDPMIIFLQVLNRGQSASIARNFGAKIVFDDGSEHIGVGYHFSNTEFDGRVIGQEDLIYDKGAKGVAAGGSITGIMTVAFDKGVIRSGNPPLLVARCEDIHGKEATSTHQMTRRSDTQIHVPGIRLRNVDGERYG